MDGTEDGIKMTVADNGVSCKLSKRLPDYVKTNVSDFVDEVRYGRSSGYRVEGGRAPLSFCT